MLEVKLKSMFNNMVLIGIPWYLSIPSCNCRTASSTLSTFNVHLAKAARLAAKAAAPMPAPSWWICNIKVVGFCWKDSLCKPHIWRLWPFQGFTIWAQHHGEPVCIVFCLLSLHCSSMQVCSSTTSNSDLNCKQPMLSVRLALRTSTWSPPLSESHLLSVLEQVQPNLCCSLQ